MVAVVPLLVVACGPAGPVTTPSTTTTTTTENYRWVYNGGEQAAPAHVLLNLAIGGGWAGRYGIADARFPTSFDIDWIRVYQRG